MRKKKRPNLGVDEDVFTIDIPPIKATSEQVALSLRRPKSVRRKVRKGSTRKKKLT